VKKAEGRETLQKKYEMVMTIIIKDK